MLKVLTVAIFSNKVLTFQFLFEFLDLLLIETSKVVEPCFGNEGS